MRLSICTLCAATLAGAELPVREVVLYKNGVGYFERAGEVPAGEGAHVAFKASEMNDVLKSLTVRDQSGGRVTGLRYESAEPIEQKLSTFPFTTEDDKITLAAFLNQLKGARVTVGFGGEKLTGIIVLARVVPVEKIGEREQLVLLLDSGEMRTVDLSASTGLQFTDAGLQAQLRDYLRVLAGGRSRDKRLLTIESVGTGKRNLIASYMIPSPVWKSSYRLIFSDKGEPTLEGWAIVDNITGEDWTKVSLALVSGRPVSFITNLYEPKNVPRATAELPEYAAINPTLYEGGVVGGVPGGVAGGVLGGIVDANRKVSALQAAPPPPRAAAMPDQARESLAVTQAFESSVSADSTTREFADLFEYRFSHPVTVRAGESTMLPFLQQKIGARKLLIYSDRSSRHPMSAAELTNSTGKTLDGGPITVFEGGSYSGEALMATLKQADKRLISYAVDLGTRVTTNLDSKSQGLRTVHFRRGVMTTRSAQRDTLTYTVHNVDAKAKVLIVEHPIRREYKLISPKPAETSATSYRFEMKLAAGATENLPVIEEREFESSQTISNLNSDFLFTYVRDEKLSDAVRRQLEKLATLKQQVEQNDRAARQVETEVRNVERDQERLRQNIASLNKVTGQQEQVGRYARTLADQETKLVALRDRQSELAQRKAALETEINALIDKMEF